MKLREETLKDIKLTLDHEPMLGHRSVFEFPEEFDFEVYTVETYKLPNIKKGLFIKYSDLEITFKDFVGPSIIHNIFENSKLLDKKNFDIIFALVDPTIVPIRGFKYRIGKVKKIEFSASHLFSCKVIFSVKKIEYVTFYE